MKTETIISSMIINGDINTIFEKLYNLIIELDYKNLSSAKYSKMEFTRGKCGFLNFKIKNCKTHLMVTLKESSKKMKQTYCLILHLIFPV